LRSFYQRSFKQRKSASRRAFFGDRPTARSLA
jgi:hypothetical protein